MAKPASEARKARRVAAKAGKPRRTGRPAAAPPPVPGEQTPIPEAALTLEQVNEILHRQVDVTRQAFFRLASVRSADLVKYEGKSWDEGGAYINAEMAGLDQQLAQAVQG